MAGLLTAQAPDTLKEVTIVADRGMVVSRTDTVRTCNSVSVTDAFAPIPGACIMDNGGPAGLKTVSLRGMGSPHTAIYIDGIRVGNAQSGQTDLGMIDMGNTEGVIIDYAQNSISFNTAKPVFAGRRTGGHIRFRGGSFGTCEPSGRLDFKLSESVSLSATASGVIARGDFPLPDGSRRLNNDIRQIRAGLDSWGIINGGDWHAKAYYNGAERGTPGTLSFPSTDRQNDRNAFLQGLVHKWFSPKYALHASAKLSRDNLTYRSRWGESFYRQTGFQLNTAHRFVIGERAGASIAAVLGRDGLDSDSYNASRTWVLATASASFNPERFKAVFTLEYAGIFDRDALQRNILSPAIDLRWNALKGFDIIAFARRAYRTPTFNELYYPGYGNPSLKAEDAWLTDIGIEYDCRPDRRWRIHLKADGFYNHLKNKIISVPTVQDPNIWQPYNIGVVRMSGADIKYSANYTGSILKGGFSVSYSYQNAIDKTPGSYTFGEQIPFISRHTAVLGADTLCKGWSVGITWSLRAGRFDSSGRMPDYNTLDITAGKTIGLPGNLALELKIMARNLTGCRYSLAQGYPMPGRAFYGEIDLKF